MSTLSFREELLFNVAKRSLPRLVVEAEDDAELELLAGFAKQFALVWDEVEQNLNDTYLLNAEVSGETGTRALDVHARDHGTRRQDSETNAGLVYRLRYLLEDSVTPSGLVAKAAAVLTAFGVTIPVGYPGLVELRRDRAVFGPEATTGFSRAYFSRGYRMTGAGRAATSIIVILPYGTSAAAGDAVAEALRQAKAGGVTVFVERRLNP